MIFGSKLVLNAVLKAIEWASNVTLVNSLEEMPWSNHSLKTHFPAQLPGNKCILTHTNRPTNSPSKWLLMLYGVFIPNLYDLVFI